MELTVDKQTQATIVAAKGKLDAAGAPELETRCKALIQEGATRLLLDFAQVEYVSRWTYNCWAFTYINENLLNTMPGTFQNEQMELF